MVPRYTIGAIARTAGIPTSTVRYYERSGLLRADGRTPGNYRIYGAAALERLRFILAAKANGFTLEDVRTLLELREGRREPCRDVQSLIEERLDDLDTRLEQLRHVQQVLQGSLERCRRAEDSGRCGTIDRLAGASPSRGGRRRTS